MRCEWWAPDPEGGVLECQMDATVHLSLFDQYLEDEKVGGNVEINLCEYHEAVTMMEANEAGNVTLLNRQELP